MLLSTHRIDATRRDLKGRTALSYAAEHGNYEVVRTVMRIDRDLASIKDHDGRNTLSWAAGQSNTDLLHFLLKEDPQSADVVDIDGWTPLTWAMKPPGYADNIQELVQSRRVDINRQDKINSRTPLSWAASYGFLSIVRILSYTKGIQIDSTDASGRTALSHAASNGNFDVVRLLLTLRGVDVNSKDHLGCTPLLWAARHGCDSVLSYLVAYPGTDLMARDEQGRLAHEIAMAYGYSRAAEILRAPISDDSRQQESV
jgi:ankyrin repeat protein